MSRLDIARRGRLPDWHSEASRRGRASDDTPEVP